MLNTELRNKNTLHIDKMSTAEMVETLHKENEHCLTAVKKALPSLTKAIDDIFPRMQSGGRLFYVGCGTSGRLGVLDASECPPTFGIAPNVVIGVIAGGDEALRYAVESAEDNAENAVSDLKNYNLTANDSVVGISAAGGAAYVTSALHYAKTLGCYTVALVCNQNTPMEKIADTTVISETGAEPITGSTRMKAGTAQKLLLNTLSSSLMIKLGYVYENLMINLRPTNSKLKDRSIRITAELLRILPVKAEDYLQRSDWNIRNAISLYQRENKE